MSDEPVGSSDETGPAPPRRQRTGGAWVRPVAGLALALVVIGGTVGAVLVALDLFEVRSSLQGARQDMAEVRSALVEVDIDRASAAVRSADGHLQQARDRTETLRWSVASVAPVAGRSITVTRQVVEVGSAAVDVADTAIADGAELLGPGITIEISGGRIDLGPLLATRELLDGLPIGRLQAARDDLAAPRSGWIPGVLLDGRADSLDLADEALAIADTAEALTTALPGFLGAEGDRRYFVGMQTPAELRGTGGLIGYFGILEIADGAITFGQSDVFEPAETAEDIAQADGDLAEDATGTGRISILGGPLSDRVETDPAFAARYDFVNAASNFSNINVDPDLPTTARVAIDLYTQRTDQSVDGLILLDPVGVERLLRVTGDVLPFRGELATELGYDDGLPTDRFARLTMIDVYETFGSGRHEQRQQVLRELGDAAFEQIVAGGWSSADMVRAITDAGRGRHVQVFSEHGGEQSAFGNIGATGALPRPFRTQDADVLAIVANNAVGGKQDVHLGHEFKIAVELGDLFETSDGTLIAARSAQLGVTVDNPLPTSGMDEYIIGSCFLPRQSVHCFEGDPGWNRTWFSAFLPTGSSLLDARTDEVSTPLREYGSYRGYEVLDHFLITPPGSRENFEVDTFGWAPLGRGDGVLTYELLWWRQAKAIPDLLDVRVTAPVGWRVVETEIVGGGDGQGFGVHADGVALDDEVVDGQAHFHGTVSADTRLRVHLSPVG